MVGLVWCGAGTFRRIVRPAFGMRIVLADDDRLIRDILSSLLTTLEPGVEVVAQCGSGPEAVAAIQREKPDLVFLDIRMPGLDGFAVVQQLPEPRPLIVFSTAFEQHAVRAFDHQALDYLLKPYEVPRLKITLDRARLALARRANSAAGRED